MDSTIKAGRSTRGRMLITATLYLTNVMAVAGESQLVRVSEDPYSDPNAQHRTEVEPIMVAHEETIVSVFQVGRFYASGADNIGWATSRDAGRTWERGFFNGTTTLVGGVWPAVSLPVAAYDEKHKTYLAAMMPFDSDGNGRGVMISRSEDGVHWAAPVTAATSGGANGHWLACDNSHDSPYFGNCYDAYLDYTSPTADYNVLVVSTDGGKTWGAPVLSPDTTAGLPTSFAVQPDGHFVILGRNAGPNGDQAYAIPSVDGGATLEPSSYISTQQFDYPWLRADPSLTSAVDREGTIYVVFPDCRFRSNCSDPGCRFETTTSFCAPNDMVLFKSRDGVTWSQPKRIPIDPLDSNTDHLIAGLAVQMRWWESEPQIALTYYFEPNANLPDGTTCTSVNCLVVAGFISSEDGGRSWKKSQAVSKPMVESRLVPTYAGEMVADYLSPVFVDGRPFGSFAIARPPNASTGLFEEAIYATPLEDCDF